jgi:diguanylate cyclase (GGDEF)-like protein
MARSLGWIALVAPVLAIVWLLVPREDHIPALPVVVAVLVTWTLSALALGGFFDRAPDWIFVVLLALAPVLVFPFVVYSDAAESGFILLFTWAAPYGFCWFPLRIAAAETAFSVACFVVARLLSPYGEETSGELLSLTIMLATTLVVLGLFARALTRAARRQERMRTHRERVLAGFGRATLDGTDERTLIDDALRIATTELGADAALMCRLDEARDVLTQEGVYAPGGPRSWTQSAEIPGGSSTLLARGMRDGFAVSDDIWADQRVVTARGITDETLHSGIAVAVRGRHGTAGAIGVYAAARARFCTDDVAFLQALANLVAAAKDHLAAEEDLRHRALHDPLTGLPNRTLLADRLQHALSSCREPGEHVAVLLVDVDRFKHVNDSLGHSVGDQLLVALAGRLSASVRHGDTLARMGGDEFVIVAERVGGTDHAEELAARIAGAWACPLQLGDRTLHVDASVGVAVSQPGMSGEELLANADAAMYRGKEQGGARSAVFDEGLRERASRQLRVEQELRRALDADELLVHFQPIVDPATLDCTSLEALVRWQHPEHGLLGPGEFIPVAETSGLIMALGARVLELALDQLAAWRRADFAFADVQVSVNISAAQLRQPGFEATLRETLSRLQLPPSALVLELTERALVRPGDPGITTAHALRRMGVELALDDFGTGYSSLSTLRSLPISTLKIDRSFVEGLGRDDADTGVISGILQMAAGSRLCVVAEGVETDAQARLLVSMGCDRAQGFHYARPLDAEAAAAFVRRASLVAGRLAGDPG